MLKYKINIADALERKGFNTYKAKITKILSQDTLKKIKKEDTNISLESINRICIILDMQPKDLIEYVEDDNEKKKYNFWKIFQIITLKSYIIAVIYTQTKGKFVSYTWQKAAFIVAFLFIYNYMPDIDIKAIYTRYRAYNGINYWHIQDIVV